MPRGVKDAKGARHWNKKLHYMQNGNLMGLSTTARDLYDYIEYTIQSVSVNNQERFIIRIDRTFYECFNKYRKDKVGSEVSYNAYLMACKALQDKNVLLRKQKGVYLFNYRDFSHTGYLDETEEHYADSKINELIAKQKE